MSSFKRVSTTQRFFFQNNRLICSLGLVPRRLVGANGLALAELDDNTLSSRLLQTDDAKTPLLSHPGGGHQNYSPYGFLQTAPSASLVAYSGQRLDILLNAYALGNGYRFYSSVLMRFFQPDGHSPFDKGGLNTYGYSRNDPINKHDPTGKWWEWLRMAIDWIKGQRPTLSIHRPITNRGNGLEPLGTVDIIVHRPDVTPSLIADPHIRISTVDYDAVSGLVENGVRGIEHLLSPHPTYRYPLGQVGLENFSTVIVNRVRNGLVAVGAAYVTDTAMNALGIASGAPGAIAHVTTHALLERGLIIRGTNALRSEIDPNID